MASPANSHAFDDSTNARIQQIATHPERHDVTPDFGRRLRQVPPPLNALPAHAQHLQQARFGTPRVGGGETDSDSGLSLEENLTPDASASPDLPESVVKQPLQQPIKHSNTHHNYVTMKPGQLKDFAQERGLVLPKTQEVTVLQNHGVYFHSASQGAFNKRDFVPPWRSIPNSVAPDNFHHPMMTSPSVDQLRVTLSVSGLQAPPSPRTLKSILKRSPVLTRQQHVDEDDVRPLHRSEPLEQRVPLLPNQYSDPGVRPNASSVNRARLQHAKQGSVDSQSSSATSGSMPTLRYNNYRIALPGSSTPYPHPHPPAPHLPSYVRPPVRLGLNRNASYSGSEADSMTSGSSASVTSASGQRPARPPTYAEWQARHGRTGSREKRPNLTDSFKTRDAHDGATCVQPVVLEARHRPPVMGGGSSGARHSADAMCEDEYVSPTLLKSFALAAISSSRLSVTCDDAPHVPHLQHTHDAASRGSKLDDTSEYVTMNAVTSLCGRDSQQGGGTSLESFASDFDARHATPDLPRQTLTSTPLQSDHSATPTQPALPTPLASTSSISINSDKPQSHLSVENLSNFDAQTPSDVSERRNSLTPTRSVTFKDERTGAVSSPRPRRSCSRNERERLFSASPNGSFGDDAGAEGEQEDSDTEEVELNSATAQDLQPPETSRSESFRIAVIGHRGGSPPPPAQTPVATSEAASKLPRILLHSDSFSSRDSPLNLFDGCTDRTDALARQETNGASSQESPVVPANTTALPAQLLPTSHAGGSSLESYSHFTPFTPSPLTKAADSGSLDHSDSDCAFQSASRPVHAHWETVQVYPISRVHSAAVGHAPHMLPHQQPPQQQISHQATVQPEFHNQHHNYNQLPHYSDQSHFSQSPQQSSPSIPPHHHDSNSHFYDPAALRAVSSHVVPDDVTRRSRDYAHVIIPEARRSSPTSAHKRAASPSGVRNRIRYSSRADEIVVLDSPSSAASAPAAARKPKRQIVTTKKKSSAYVNYCERYNKMVPQEQRCVVVGTRRGRGSRRSGARVRALMRYVVVCRRRIVRLKAFLLNLFGAECPIEAVRRRWSLLHCGAAFSCKSVIIPCETCLAVRRRQRRRAAASSLCVCRLNAA